MDKEREGERGLREVHYLVVWRSAFALISAWGDCSKIYVTHRRGRFPESY